MIESNKDKWKKVDESFLTTGQFDDYLYRIIKSMGEESEKRAFKSVKIQAKYVTLY